ncbi:MAG TPA: methyltransferase domain-containing protein [Gaiellaceae bacterium]|nr:methyltransferase domain-containing protein [Gaiellaceae bacterium]
MSSIEKFDRLARGYAAHDYADPARYAARRAEVALALGPRVAPGAAVLDLACGDANMAEPFLERGFRYAGVDGSAAMVEEARRRLGDRAPLAVASLDDYVPPAPVELTICLRAFYYAADRRAFFRRVAGYTTTKFVFDFDPRVYDRGGLEADLLASGFERLCFRPFFLPQRVAVPAPLRAALAALEHTGPLARAALRVRGIWFCAALPAATAPGRT